MRRYVVALGLVLASGCGGTENGPGGAGTDGGGGAGGTDASVFRGGMSWKYDGVLHTAQVVMAARRKDSTIDFLEIIGAQSTGDGLAIAISDTTANNPNTIGGAYVCPSARNAIVIFTYNVTGANSPMSCMVTLAQAGVVGSQNAVGTFSAVLSNGKSITEGMFDAPVTKNGP